MRPILVCGGSAFQTRGSEREARTRLYSDLEASAILQNKLVPLSPDSPINVQINLNIYKVGHDIKVVPMASKTDLIGGLAEHVTIPAEWEVTNSSLEVTHLDGLPQVVYTVHLDRASIYYLLCVLSPMAVTSQLTLFVFWIPPTSGERISFLMSIYVSTTLYLGFVGDTLPRKSYNFVEAPRMVLFMVFNITECVLVLIATLLSMRLHTAEEKALQNLLVEETERIRRKLKTKDGGQDKGFRNKGAVKVLDLTEDHEQTKADDIPNYLAKGCFEDTPGNLDNRHQLATADDKDATGDHRVGTASRKRRFYERVTRFLAQQKKSKKPCRICAQTVDRVLFLVFLTCSLVFYSFIFGED
ncbi:neuronal acetylcholine receptor subunit alpha-7 [Elysia marginata]|uniref:Neuronal acetylcholine receptor subunit alpha-7 n=1 Tax=Elysia marginata TaxID=1093978 RepID=A0AAV4FYU2_9GAST|nr:neuronal acetylcholine receptor subunit alpha-7 [Elysia marginata]